MTDTIDREELDTTCDGLFLLLDTARHGGFTITDNEIAEHIRECATCLAVNAHLLD